MEEISVNIITLNLTSIFFVVSTLILIDVPSNIMTITGAVILITLLATLIYIWTRQIVLSIFQFTKKPIKGTFSILFSLFWIYSCIGFIGFILEMRFID